MPAIAIPSPFTVTDGSDIVTVNHPGHGLSTGDEVVISDAQSVGRIVPSGTYAVTVTDEDTYTIDHSANADLAETLGNNPLTTVSGSPVVTITDTAHGFSTGLIVTISGASATNGITPNGSYAITVVDANSYTISTTTNASGAGSGGGASVVVTVPATGGGTPTIAPQNPFQAGSIDGAGGAGFGTGSYGVGVYGSPSEEDFYPRTWAFSSLGQWLVANPRGGTIYAWKNDQNTVAAPILNAPRQVTCALVGPNDEVFAFGCNEMVSGDFNPLCIRHSALRSPFGPQHETWRQSTSNNAREYVLRGGGRIVSARRVGRYILVWTTNSLYLGQYVGSETNVWKFDPVGENCGLIGPNAAVIVGQTAYWVSPDLQFRYCDLGGAPGILPCPIREDFADNLALVQGDKIVASSCAPFNEIRFDYPDGRDGPGGVNGVENSRYLAASVDLLRALPDQAWYRGVMARSAMADAGASPHPIGADPTGNLYLHERGQSADGGFLSWHLESADFYISEDLSAIVTTVWPDMSEQVGAVGITVTTRMKPQGDERAQGPKTASPSADKVDFRISGRLVRIKYEGNAAPTAMRLGTPIVGWQARGKR